MPSEVIINECPIPAGILLIIGGKENKGKVDLENREAPEGFDPLEILKRFIELTGKQRPIVEIITSASTEGNESYEEYKRLFETLGIESPGHIHHHKRSEVLGDDVLSRVKMADAFFFSGGDQLLLSSLYGGTPFLTELKNRYINNKIVIGGTSAGAMAMSTPMIYAGSEEVQQIGGEIKITTGLEFLKDVCIDTHFVHRGRFIRLAQVIATNPTCIGMGIEEDTAVVISNGQNADVIGSGTIIVIRGHSISESSMDDFQNKKPISIRNLNVDILAKGDTFKIEQTNPPHF